MADVRLLVEEDGVARSNHPAPKRLKNRSCEGLHGGGRVPARARALMQTRVRELVLEGGVRELVFEGGGRDELAGDVDVDVEEVDVGGGDGRGRYSRGSSRRKSERAERRVEARVRLLDEDLGEVEEVERDGGA